MTFVGGSTGIATRRFGWIADPEGLNPLAALSSHFPQLANPPAQRPRIGSSAPKLIVLFEASSPQRAFPASPPSIIWSPR